MRSLCLTEIKNCHFKNFDKTSFTSIKIVDILIFDFSCNKFFPELVKLKAVLAFLQFSF